MCDTFIHFSSVPDKSIFFGKNSDREPNEAQHIVQYPAVRREQSKVKATYIEVEHPQQVCSVILCQPFQMWGAEMGVNEHGVVIGNEAVFTKVKFDKKNIGLTGMDLLRLSLEVSKTSKEALNNILHYLSQYGQNAPSGYTDKNFYYHNSFMIADKNEGYILDTAGNFWVYKKVMEGYRAISNGLSIEYDFDAVHPEAKAYASKHGWIKKGEKFSFKKAFSAFWMPKLAACEARRNLSESKGKSVDEFSVKHAFDILRSHTGEHASFKPEKGTTASVCMHASGLFTPHQSVGAMVVELKKNFPPTIWLTGTSGTCLSLFKPFYLHSPVLLPEKMTKPIAVANNSLWWQWEQLHRRAILDYSFYHLKMQSLQTLWETQWIEEDRHIVENNLVAEQGHKLSETSLKQSLEAMKEILTNRLPEVHSKSILYRRFWKKINKQAAFTIE